MGPIIRSFARNRLRAGLLIVEIAVTLAIVVNCLALLLEQRQKLIQPTGIDEANLIAVEMMPWDGAYRDDGFRQQLIRRDLASLMALPGAVSASAIRPFPLQGGGSSLQLKALGAPDERKIRAPRYTADEKVLETLGLELVAGRGFTIDDVPLENGPRILNCLVTQDLADAVFPDGDALGQSIDTGSEEWPDIIVGIVRRMHTPYGGGPMEDRILIYPGLPGNGSFMSYMVRAEPGQLDGLVPAVEDTILANDGRRVVRVRPLADYKAQGYSLNRFVAAVLVVIIILLLAVTSLGLFGMTSFSVSQRTKEIGTRRALGASRGMILGQFLLESGLIAAVGSAFGLIGAYGLNRVLVTSMDAMPLAPELVVGGVAVLWLVGLAATIVPATRASRMEPALATRTV